MSSSRSIKFIRQNSSKTSGHLLLHETVANEIMAMKLPFTEKAYYTFCEKYVDDDAEEALYMDEANNYFREITTDYDTLKYFSFLRQFYNSPAFCDIGCGIGNLLYFAGKIGYQSFGYEINKTLHPIHKKLKLDVVYEDITTSDFTRLQTANIIYLYRPINDDVLMDRLFARIYKETAEDVIVLYNYPHTRQIKGFDTITLNPYDDHVIMLIKQ